MEFKPLEDFENARRTLPILGSNESRRAAKLKDNESNAVRTNKQVLEKEPWEPNRLENGKWACNHRCKDKTL